MTHLDGNALAGTLADLLGHDLTNAQARCAECGQVAVLAIADVYLTAMGAVVRCRGCGSVEAVLVLAAEHHRVSLAGLTAIEIPTG